MTVTALSDLRRKDSPVFMRAYGFYPYSEDLQGRYTLISRFDDTFELGYKMGALYGVPRGLCPIPQDDRRVKGVPVKFESKISPKNAQQVRLISEMESMLADGESFVLQAPTGTGKTVIALQAIATHGRKTLVIVTDEDLKVQWRRRAIEFLGLSPKDIGTIQGDVYDTVGKKLVIGMVQSICKGKYPDYIFDDFGVTIWDECHRMNANQFCKSIACISSICRVGLSAEPRRKDGKDVVFTSNIGPVRARGEISQLTPDVMFVSTPWKPSGKWVYRVQSGKIAALVRDLSRNMERNLVIANFVKQAYDKDRNIVVFSDLAVEKHLASLRKYIVSQGVPDSDIGYYVGGMTEKQRDRSAAKRVVLATYSMCGTGTDVPWWDTCFLATPRAHVMQVVGRIRREYDGKKKPVVVDFVDDFKVPVVKQYYSSRRKWYGEIGANFSFK